MPKTAIDPFFTTNNEPVSAGRKAYAVPSLGQTSDLPHVSSSLIISASAAGSITVIMANDPDGLSVQIPVTVGLVQLSIQVRAVVNISSASISVIALYS